MFQRYFRRPLCGILGFILLAIAELVGPPPIHAEPRVVVLASYYPETVQYTLRTAQGAGYQAAITRGDVVTIVATQPIRIDVAAGEQRAAQAALPGEAILIAPSDTARDSPPALLRLFRPALTSSDAAETPNSHARGLLPEDEAAARWLARLRPPTTETGYTHTGRLWGLEGKPETLRIPVKILADDNEPATRRIWEPILRQRLAEANAILQNACGVQFEVVAVGEWYSDDSQEEFAESFREFAEKVDPAPAALAIGFTSQYPYDAPEPRLGGAGGLLGRHILVRNAGPKVTEVERLQILLHELGHYLGATHIDDADSVMRAQLKDRFARARSFGIGFDPLNTLAMNLFVDDVLQEQGRADKLSLATIKQLRRVYEVAEKITPGDATATKMLAILDRMQAAQEPPSEPTEKLAEGQRPETADPPRGDGRAAATAPKPPPESPVSETAPTPESAPADTAGDPRLAQSSQRAPSPPQPAEQEIASRDSFSGQLATVAPRGNTLIDAVRAILASVVETAEKSRPLEAGNQANPTRTDAWVEFLIRKAAQAADELPAAHEGHAHTAFLVALAIAFDDSDMLRSQPVIGSFYRRVESDTDRKRRIQALGKPRISGRHDWAQHFAVSAGLTALLGRSLAESAGVAKEWQDSDGGSGWSFADLGADLAGIEFADGLIDGDLQLRDVARNFRLKDFVPELSQYEEGLTREQVERRFGGSSGEAMQQRIEAIRREVQLRPGYR